MSQKRRNRSANWDKQEKQLFRHVLKDYKEIIENKSLDTNTNRIKSRAWEEVHLRFNQSNSRPRELSSLRHHWKIMKRADRRAAADKEDLDLTNNVTAIGNESNEQPDTSEDDTTIEQTSEEDISMEPVKKSNGISPTRKMPKWRKFLNNTSGNGTKSRKDHEEYLSSILGYSKMLKNKEHEGRMEMANEEHTIKMLILKKELETQAEKLKCAVIEREILELKKAREASNFN